MPVSEAFLGYSAFLSPFFAMTSRHSILTTTLPEALLRLRPILLRTILLLTLAVAGAHFKGAAAFAQEPQAPAAAQEAPLTDTPLDQAAKEIEKAKVQLTALQDGAKQNADNDDALVGLATKADELSRAVITISVNLRPRFDQIKNRLAEIGDPPKDGQPPEAKIVTDERNALTAERAQINAVTGDAENLSIAVTKLLNEIIEMRRRLFADTLFRRTEISVSVLDDAVSAFVHEASEFSQALSSWASFVWKFKRFPLFAAIFLSLASALILLSGSYRLFGSYLRRDEAIENPSYIGRCRSPSGRR